MLLFVRTCWSGSNVFIINCESISSLPPAQQNALMQYVQPNNVFLHAQLEKHDLGLGVILRTKSLNSEVVGTILFNQTTVITVRVAIIYKDGMNNTCCSLIVHLHCMHMLLIWSQNKIITHIFSGRFGVCASQGQKLARRENPKIIVVFLLQIYHNLYLYWSTRTVATGNKQTPNTVMPYPRFKYWQELVNLFYPKYFLTNLISLEILFSFCI